MTSNIQMTSDIQTPWVTVGVHSTVRWREEAKGTGTHVFRAVVCGVALAGLAIGGLIEATASLALAILTCPSLIAGSSLSTNLLHRGWKSLGFSGLALTYCQYKNLFPGNAKPPNNM